MVILAIQLNLSLNMIMKIYNNNCYCVESEIIIINHIMLLIIYILLSGIISNKSKGMYVIPAQSIHIS